MISSLSWVPRGAAKLKPDFVEIDENDIEAMKAMKKYNERSQVGAALLACNTCIVMFLSCTGVIRVIDLRDVYVGGR